MASRLILLTIFTILNFSSFGCVCSDWAFMPAVNDKHLDEDNYQILSAKVIDIKSITEPLYSDTTGLSDYQKSHKRTYNLITLSIIENYGSTITADTITIATGTMSALDCGFPFKKNKKYLITLSKNNDGQQRFWTSICVPTRKLKDAKEDIAFIEKNKKERLPTKSKQH